MCGPKGTTVLRVEHCNATSLCSKRISSIDLSFKRKLNASSFIDVCRSTIFFKQIYRWIFRGTTVFHGYDSSISLCSIHISMSFSLFPSCSLFLGLSLSLLLSMSTGKVFSGQKLIKIGGKDVVGLDNSDIAVLILGAPGVSSKYMYLCMHVCMGGALCMFVCARACECVREFFKRIPRISSNAMYRCGWTALQRWLPRSSD